MSGTMFAWQPLYDRLQDWGLQDWAGERGVELPSVPEHCQQPYHLFCLLLPSPESRQALIRHLKDRGILSVFHYVPLHLSKMGQRFDTGPQGCPVTEDVSERLLRLPFYADLDRKDQDRVLEAIYAYDGP